MLLLDWESLLLFLASKSVFVFIFVFQNQSMLLEKHKSFLTKEEMSLLLTRLKQERRLVLN